MKKTIQRNILLNKKDGIALISVLLLIPVLLILLTSMVFLTSEILRRTRSDLNKNMINPLSDSALTEAIILLEDNIEWGKNKEKLFMKSENQDLKIAGFNSKYLPEPDSQFIFENQGAFYVSFDPNDPVWGDKKYYSVNNLGGSSSVPGYRHDMEVPPNSALIVITAASDDEVRHVEVIVTAIPNGIVQSGSRGAITITTNKLGIETIGGPFNLHSNARDVSVKIIDLPDNKNLIFDIKNECKVTANAQISSPVNDPNHFKSNSGTKDIPLLDISELVANETFEPGEIPSGTYIRDGNLLNYYKDGNVPPNKPDRVIYKGDEIVAGLKFDGKNLLMDRALKVAYDIEHLPGKTGNVAFNGIELKADNSTLYAPGNKERDFTKDGGPYHYGNVILKNSDDDAIKGKGNIYAEGTIELEGNKISSKALKFTRNSDRISLYSSGDIRMNMIDGDARFEGLIYTMGDFYCTVPKDKKIELTGAILVAGKDPSEDPKGALFDPGIMSLEGNEVKFKFDETFLSPLPSVNKGGTYGFKIIYWYKSM